MKKSKFGILIVLAILALVSVASAALPSEIDGDIHSGTSSYIRLDVTNGGDDLPTGSSWNNVWCVDSGPVIYIGPTYNFHLISSLTNPSFAGRTIHWQQINYVINHYSEWSLDPTELQTVIWHYDGAPLASPTGDINHAITDTDAFFNNQANANWWPGCGQVYAVVLDAQEAPGAAQIQLLIMVWPMPECTNTPEFPTLALPVGMIIGVAGIVYVARSREK